jgi:shikimate dehydrogenase
MADRYAVIGNPIEHSKSPTIHQAFALQTGQDIEYERVLAPLRGFADTLAGLRTSGYRGANVTVPFKFEACGVAQRLSERAKAAGAVNTLLLDGDEIVGDNTDGIGLVRDIEQNLGHDLAGKRVLLVGAGGAAEGVLLPLLERQPEQLVIVNRSVDKASAMAEKAKPIAAAQGVELSAAAFDTLAARQFDTVINATSTGLNEATLPLPPTIFGCEALAYDMMYGRETPFMRFARNHGAVIVADGLGMLVEQAAAAFQLWRGVHPQTAPVIAQLRA